MNYLAIETSTTRASVALMVEEHFYHVEHDILREHAQSILPMIQQLLSQANIALSQLDGIVFGRGPGSFTGLRIACSVVKGLAYPHSLPVYPVSSLAAIAEEVFYFDPELAPETHVLTMIDARMQAVYWDCYTSNGEHQREQVASVSTITVPQEVPLIFAGVGFEAYHSELPLAIQKQCVQQREIFPDARAMIRLVVAGKCRPVSAGEALPVYVRNQVVQGASGG